MTPLRNLLHDLVEKRLWPIALVLVVALVAIPVLVGGSSSPGDASGLDPTVAGAGPAASATPAVQLVGPPAVRSRPGKLRDPFRRKKVKVAAEPATKAAPPAAAAASPKASTKSSAGSGGGAVAPRTAEPPPAPPVVSIADRSYYETVAHLKGPHADYGHPLDRLAVFGDKLSPAAQYLGVSSGGEYAIFVLGPAATAVGHQGACVVPDPCRAIGLRKGESLHIAVAGPGAVVRHYRLDVTGLRRVTLQTAAAAQAARAAVARGGREVLRTMVEDPPTLKALGRLRYGLGTGTLALVGVG